MIIIREFVRSLSFYSDLRIRLEGHLDTSEILRRDEGLDLRRADAVADALVSLGLPADADTRIEPMGSRLLLVPTPPNTAEPQNRRVVLIVSAGKQVRPSPYQAECLAWLKTHDCGDAVGSAQLSVCKRVRRAAAQFIDGAGR